MLSRRQLLALSAAAGLVGCASRDEPDAAASSSSSSSASSSTEGRITARPREVTADAERGSQRLANGALYVPRAYDSKRAAPLIVALHGAGGNPLSMINLLTPHADRVGAILYAPASTGSTWDVIERKLGPDVARLDQALEKIFADYNVDAKRVAVSGFSDGASYALTLGVANGDLFTHILAFSPGFMSAPAQHGRPRVYVSHGTADRVLPIDRCSRALVPRLKAGGYDVLYREFEGPHTVPQDLATEAVDWFVAM